MASDPAGASFADNPGGTYRGLPGDVYAAQRGVRGSQRTAAGGYGGRQQWCPPATRSPGNGANGAGGGTGASKGARPGDNRKGKPGNAEFRCGFCGANDHRQSECELKLEQQLAKAVAGLLRVRRDIGQVQASFESYLSFYSDKYGLDATANAVRQEPGTAQSTTVNAVQGAVHMQRTVRTGDAGQQARAEADRVVQEMQRAMEETKRERKEKAERQREEKKELVERKRAERKAKAAAKASERRSREREREDKEREKKETEKRLRQQLFAEVRKNAAIEREKEMAEMREEMRRELIGYQKQFHAARETMGTELLERVSDGILTVIGRVNECEDKVGKVQAQVQATITVQQQQLEQLVELLQAEQEGADMGQGAVEQKVVRVVEEPLARATVATVKGTEDCVARPAGKKIAAVEQAQAVQERESVGAVEQTQAVMGRSRSWWSVGAMEQSAEAWEDAETEARVKAKVRARARARAKEKAEAERAKAEEAGAE